MSNQITILPTKFVDMNTNEESFGVRIFDSYGYDYIDTWDFVFDDDFDLLRQTIEVCYNNGSVAGDMLKHCYEHGSGLRIGGIFYGWDEIKHCFPESE